MIAHAMDDLSDHTIELGDRVEVFRGNQFGVILATREEDQALFMQVALGDGSVRWLRKNQAWYAPSPKELLQRASAIKSSWSPTTLLSRQALPRDDEPLSVPLVHDAWDASMKNFGRVI